jgi:predicted DNA-binding protein with PD1-like motif
MTNRIEAAPARAGRIIVGRLHPGSDLIGGLEAACDEHGIEFAAVLACYGSLSSAGFKFLQIPDGEDRARLVDVALDKRVEFMGGQGLVCVASDETRATHLHGSVSDETGSVMGGHFTAGQNPVYNNMDFVVQELLGVRLVRLHDPVTNTVEMQVEAVDAGDPG